MAPYLHLWVRYFLNIENGLKHREDRKHTIKIDFRSFFCFFFSFTSKYKYIIQRPLVINVIKTNNEIWRHRSSSFLLNGRDTIWCYPWNNNKKVNDTWGGGVWRCGQQWQWEWVWCFFPSSANEKGLYFPK
jgi:hypothetical protein